MTPAQPSIQEIVTSLDSDRAEERERAAEQLKAKGKEGLTVTEGIIALRAAAKTYLPRKYDFLDSSADLVQAVRSRPRREYIPVIKELFPAYKPRVKAEAMVILAAIEGREAVVAYMEMVTTYARSGELLALPTGPLESKPRYADVFFPRLLDYVDVPAFERSMYSLLLKYAQVGLLKPLDLAVHSPRVLESYFQYEDKVRSAQRTEGIAWMSDEEYDKVRWRTALLLDVLGYFPHPQVKGELREALGYTDPRLKFFAAMSLLRLGEDVNAEIIHDLAKYPEVRNMLYDELVAMRKISLSPQQFRTQEALAESNMVNWLIFPTELARVPDEIELMKVISVDSKTRDGFLDYYVFRFRVYDPDNPAAEGWEAGVAGPFLRKDAPSTDSYGSTFSSFKPWDSMTAEGHFADLVGSEEDILAEWR